jgi:AraC-like DNA-binding protein
MKRNYIEGEWINALMRAFTNLGLDTQAIIKDLAGFDHQGVISGHRLDVGAARQMWHRADQQARDPLLGLKAGSTLDYRAVGVLTPVIWHSPTVRVALTNIATFQSLISESGAYKIIESSNVLTHFKNEALPCAELVCEYIPTQNAVPINPHQVLAVVSGTLGIIHAISNGQVHAKSLQFPSIFKDSLDADLLEAALKQQHINCQVRAMGEHFSLSFNNKHLDTPLPGCDAHLYEINKSYAEELLRAKRAGRALIDSIKDIIVQQGYSLATIEDVQKQLGLHSRTLQRNLLEQGTKFRQIKEELLKEHAIHLLIGKKNNINDVAQQLGYSETSAFHRAFKVWCGMTPKQFCKIRHF